MTKKEAKDKLRQAKSALRMVNAILERQEQGVQEIKDEIERLQEIINKPDRWQGSLVQPGESNYILFSMLKPKLYKDGNEWCVLYGENIQEGIVGFGSTPLKAVLDWNQQWSKEDREVL